MTTKRNPAAISAAPSSDGASSVGSRRFASRWNASGRGARRLLVVVGLAVGLSATGCTGDADTGAAESDTGSAESDDADAGSAASNGGTGDSDTGDDTAGPDTGSSGGVGQETGTVECAVVDDRAIEVVYTNAGRDPIDLVGELEVTAGSASDVVRPGIRGVAPGEQVAVRATAAPASPDPLDSCSTDGLAIVARADIDSDWAADVGSCTDFREDLLTTSLFDLSVTNPSDAVPAYYEITVVVRDPDGVRRANAYVVSKPNAVELAPGETTTQSESITFPFDDFGAGYTCEVAQVVRHTSLDVLTDEGGVITGSLEADVAFATGSAELSSDGVALVNKVVERVADHDGPICIEGFADSVGDDADNLTLSQERAESVQAHLVANGVTNEIEAVGFGESEATVDDVDDPSLRRVDITLAACTS